MAKVYYRAIKANKKTINDVSTKWRAAVRALLDADDTDESAE